jgi:polyphenol oxidase
MINVFEDESLKGSKISHGFFSRHGGHSTGIYKGLNVGLGSNDEIATVNKNRSLVANHMDIELSHLQTLYQIHSNKVITITNNTPFKKPVKADAMVTNVPGQALGILTADCTPVLFADFNAGVIGAAHAGWKGALGGVLTNTISAMEKLGAKRLNIKAVIGPSISQDSYEVGSEFRDVFLDKSPSYDAFFKPNINNKYQFNLVGFNEKMLQDAQIESVENLNLNTYSMEDDFYSFRRTTHRDEPDYGRQISVILLT